MRTVATGLVLIMVVTLGLSGCATIEENPKTAVGTGVGAAGGALLGGLIGRSTTGVVVGGLLGALAGGAIGHYMDRQDRTAAQAKAQTGYQPSQGTLVRVERVQAEPAAISPGGTVNLGATYSVLTPNPNQTVSVNETREVRHDGVLVANPTTAFARPNGTFTSALPVALPASAARGTYEVTTTVTVGDRSSRGIATFVVR
ncbi:MAG: glycine zipper 2TM domain-containing protein [candidate division NC10 bacterium]|nr:glycine zipper 2TM domain-containing protein [candidate division NC10 bacterium]